MEIDSGLLRQLFDALIPGDRWPGAGDVAAHRHALEVAANDEAVRWTLTAGLQGLGADARVRFGRRLGELDAAHVTALLDAAERNGTATGWSTSPPAFVELAARLAAEGYYGAQGSPAWPMIGFDPAQKRSPGIDPAPHVVPRATPFDAIKPSYDVVVVGAGAGGGVAAYVLAAAGIDVLLADRGEVLPYEAISRDHLRNHRLSLYGHNTGPGGGNPRVVVDALGEESTVPDAHSRAWQNNAMTVGGGTRVYQGMAWRFLPDDFLMASRYGVPARSSLADWPIGYDELEPYYSRAEWELGVCGEDGAHPAHGHRSKPYPMGPLPWNREAELLVRGAAKLGINTGAVPLLINSEPRDGRARCVQCSECGGFPCPSDAKNGTHNTVVPRAIATGCCALVAPCRAVRIRTDGVGRVTGVDLVEPGTRRRVAVNAKHVVLAAGAIETARLLLLSATEPEPNGLGNGSDQVGRHLQGHLYTGAYGLFDEPVQDMRGPGVRIATCDYNHGNEGVFGGGVIANDVIKLPVMFWHRALPPGAPRWGEAGKRYMRDAYLRTGHLSGPVQEIPSAAQRVTIAPGVKDSAGIPVARIEGVLHPETLRTARHQAARARAWLEASGARDVWSPPFTDAITAGQHQAGTCRMGEDPAASVTDAWGRVHGHANLWVMDASTHVTNGGFNPVLTIYALAFRNAERLAREG